MTDTRPSIPGHRNERGSALLGVVLLLMLMSALAAALAVSGETETLISRNHQSGARAHAAAEAGLNHAVELATTFIFEFAKNGFGSADAAIDSLLAGVDGNPAAMDDNGGFDVRTGIVAGEDIPSSGPNVAVPGGLNVSYTAFVMDDDDSPPPAAYPENGNSADDANRVLIVQAIGFGPDATTVTLEAVIGAVDATGIVSNGNVALGGNFSVTGASGGVHANGNLTMSGSVDVEQNATASGTASCGGASVGGFCGGSQPAIPIPPIRASDYRNLANRILTSDGRVLAKDPVTHVETYLAGPGAGTAAHGWSFSGGTWSNNATANGTFYIQGNANVKNDLTATLLVEGNVDVSGNSNFKPKQLGLFMVIDGDLDMTGGSDMVVGFEGAILVHEQVRLRGNTTIRGQLLIENAANNSSLVTENDFRGNADVIYGGGLSWAGYSVRSWREVR